MGKSFKAKDKKPVADGARAALVLQHGETERTVSGVIRAFDDEDGKQRWEVLTGDPAHPAVGFLPKNVISAS